MSTTEEITTPHDAAVDDPSKPAPSGFVLKLFQMVNGSDDEVIKVRMPQRSYSILLKMSSKVLYENNMPAHGVAVRGFCLFSGRRILVSKEFGRADPKRVIHGTICSWLLRGRLLAL